MRGIASWVRCGGHALAATLLAFPASAQEPDPRVLARVESLLAEAPVAPPNPEKLARSLATTLPESAGCLRTYLLDGKAGLHTVSLVQALRWSRSSETVQVVATLADSPDAEVRAAVFEALVHLSDFGSVEALLDPLDRTSNPYWDEVSATILQIARARTGRQATAKLSECVKRMRHPERCTRLLAEIGTEAALRALSELAIGGSPKQQLAALQGLLLVADASHLPIGLELLRNYDPAVRKQACLLLGLTGLGEAIEPLLELLDDAEPGVVANAGWALRRITKLELRAERELWSLWWERTGRREWTSPEKDALRD